MIRGGLCDTVTLALSLPTTPEYWWTLQTIAFGVVLFTLSARAMTNAPLLRYYGSNKQLFTPIDSDRESMLTISSHPNPAYKNRN